MKTVLSFGKIQNENAEELKSEYRRRGADKVLIIILAVLLSLGTLIIFSASYPYAL